MLFLILSCLLLAIGVTYMRKTYNRVMNIEENIKQILKTETPPEDPPPNPPGNGNQ